MANPRVILIHGNGLTAISQKISEIKKSFDPLSIIEFTSKEVSPEEALVKISTSSLFSDKRLVVLEEFEKVDTLRFPEDEKLTIVLKFSKQLSANSLILKEAVKFKAEIINLSEKDEQSVFPFLDNLAEKNSRAFKLFESLYEEYGGQYLLTMICYMLRRLILKPRSNLPGFVLQKLERQKRNFTEDKIKKFYRYLLETDFKIKSGLIEDRLGLTLVVERILKA